jgi:hypothetical protein
VYDLSQSEKTVGGEDVARATTHYDGNKPAHCILLTDCIIKLRSDNLLIHDDTVIE